MTEIILIETPKEHRITEKTFLDFVEYIDAAPLTVQTYTRALRRFFFYLRDQGIDKPSRQDILVFRDHLKESCKPATVQIYLTAIRLFFRWTAESNIYPNVAERIKGAKIDKGHKKDYLTSRQVQKVLSNIDRDAPCGLRDYAIFLLMVVGGLRVIEIVRANVGDIQTLGDAIVLYIQGKGREERTEYVRLVAPVEDAVREYLGAIGNRGGDQPLFTSKANRNSGGRLTTRSVSRIIKQRLQSVGYDSERLSAHSLRHTAGTLNLLHGGSLEETQQLLRHGNINTTMIYAHHLQRANNQSEARIAQAIFSAEED